MADPVQDPITDERVQRMLTQKPRRMQLSKEWPEPLHEPAGVGRDWRLTLPFQETLGNAFKCMCKVETIGLRESKGRCWTYLRDTAWNDAPLQRVREWLSTIGQYVALRDCLALSFALDYDRGGGDPAQPQTEVGALRGLAKPYGAPPTGQTYAAADSLANKLLAFIAELPCYQGLDAIVAMPPSDPAKLFDLPSYLAGLVAHGLKAANLTSCVTTTRQRPPLKATQLRAKMAAIAGTIEVAPCVFSGRSVLLIDDLYQSGVSLNYVAKLLLEAGASRVLGLSCEKTCRNDDNVRGA